jgi:hypothetical protein
MDDKFYTIRVPKQLGRMTAIVGVLALIVAPLAAVATHSFSDVPDSHTFHGNIEWLKASGVTKGCNPPANTLFCPDDNVTRGQMAAFMERFAEYLGAEDGTPAQADNATTADSAPPVGPAGGVLSGSYPNPDLADNEPFRIVGTAGQPSFQNGWGNLDLGFSQAGFFKDHQNVVHLKGTLTGGAGANGEVAFTLPEGYRPSQNLVLPMAGGGPVAANLQIFTDGTVEPTCDGGGCTAGIDGLSFRVGVGGASQAPAPEGEGPND